jgi:NTP pyrophosphatase (non-canonical NTP hydrolase)
MVPYSKPMLNQSASIKHQTSNPEFQISNFQIMTIENAQTQVDEWIKTVGVRYFNELTNLGILMEEVGELSRLMVRQYGEQSFKESDKGKELCDEMADVLWVLICLANQTGVDLTKALEKNFEKKNIRDITRHRDNEKLQ